MDLNYKNNCTDGLTVRYSRNKDDDESEWRIGKISTCLEEDDEFKQNGCRCRFTNGAIGFAREVFQLDPLQIKDEFIDELIKNDEFLMVEFKETYSAESETGTEKKCLRDAVVKNVAGMMNNQGGYIIIGLKEHQPNPIVVGLEPDFNLIRPSIQRSTQSVEDKFMLEVGAYIKSKLKDGRLENKYVIHPIKKYKDKQICIIEVKQSIEIPVLVDEDVQTIDCRTGNWKGGKKYQVYYVKEPSTSATPHDIRERF
tara:strand:+ start:452 stop:1216 length:765 start_codon:yes stop_codon:yes gene_type:complete